MPDEQARAPKQGPTPKKKRHSRSRGGFRAVAKALLYVVIVIGLSILLAAVGWVCAGDVLALNKPAHTAVVVLPEGYFTDREVVESEDGVERTRTVHAVDIKRVAALLKENGLIEFEDLFRLFAWFTHADTKMKPGTYTLNTEMDYRALISGLNGGSGSRAEVSVTIPEGYTVAQIFSLLEEKGVASVAELNDMAANHDYQFDFLADIPLGDPGRLEGYLFPDTYNFYVGESPLYAINKMLVNFTVYMPREQREALKEEGKSLHEIITIASLIEKETDGTDQATIASVIRNRMEHPERETAGFLQIDATLAYLNGGAVPTEADKDIDSPYNTYLHRGLPPGPIANPGQAAIYAALNPAETNYYYYALGKDGLHHFSRTYQEHLSFLNTLK